MNDYIVRATAGDGSIRAFAATTRGLVQKAREIHHTSPVASAALGRLLTAAAMMGSMLKGDKDLVTLQIRGDGPLQGIVVSGDCCGRVKGYVFNPNVELPDKYPGKLDVGGAIGAGYLDVIKDIGMREPYAGRIELVTGEIAEDLTYYFASSEQIPSSVGLGVLMSKENTVKRSGGFILQLLPFTDEETISRLEDRISQLTSITALLEKGDTPELLLKEVLGEIPFEVTETIPAKFWCGCSKERISKSLATLGKKELDEMIAEGQGIEVKCHFCNTDYTFSADELKEIRN